MRARFLLLLAALQVGWAPAVQAADPLHSSSCRQAMTALRAQEDRELAARPAAPGASDADRAASAANAQQPSARVQALRRDAARACLGGPDDPLVLHHHVAPPAPVMPPVTPPVTLPAFVAPPVRQPTLPPVITACDASGCWSSDGAWMQRAGPNLQGPRGLCLVQNGMVVCP